MTTNAWLMLSGAVLFAVGFLLRWKVSSYDLKDAALESAWTLARRKRTAENPTALEAKYREIQSQPTLTGKATRAAGTVAGHFIAQVLGVVALIMMLCGLVLGAAGYFWR